MNKIKLAMVATIISLIASLGFAQTIVAPVVVPTVNVAVFTHNHDDWDNEMPVKEQETIRKAFTLNAAVADKKLDIDNVFGSISVVGTSGDQIQVVVTKTIKAESKADVELARKEVTMDMTQDGNSVRLFVNGPFRCGCNGGCCGGWHEERGYVVHMDFQVQVPNNLDLALKTVNQG